MEQDIPHNELLLVLGYARSGTSALTRVLSLCGYGLPKKVFGATGLNPTGHWEPVDATHLNLDFVTRHQLASDITMRCEEIDISAIERESFVGKIQELLRKCTGPVVIKEFRINELTEFWIEAARRENRTVRAVIAVRHPQEVFRSSVKGFGNSRSAQPPPERDVEPPIEPFSASWLKTNLQAERNTRSIPRVFVEYPNLVADWRREVARVASALSTDLLPDTSAIDEFLTPSLHRQRYRGPVVETFAYSWMTRVYAVLSAAAQDVPIDMSTMDEIYHGYRRTSRTLRMAMESLKPGEVSQAIRNFVDRLPVWESEDGFKVTPHGTASGSK